MNNRYIRKEHSLRFNPCTISLLSISLFSACVPGLAQKKDDALKLNQIQVIGTHNSYHAGFAPSESKLWQAKNPRAYDGLDYRHQPLPMQLDGGVRQIELDIFADTEGGRYAHPLGPVMVAKAGMPADPPFDPDGVMAKPGFKVMHVQDVDYRSTCQPFTACLAQVRTWSHAHPGHIPIFILVETKEDVPEEMDLTKPEPFTAPTFDALDAEIRSVFSSDEMIVPDQIRGAYSTLNEAVVAGNWPTLANARGKVVFLLDQQHVGPIYLAGHPSLRGRVLFTNASPGEPDAAFVERNDGPQEEISKLVRQGYLVRTRADGDTKEARVNDVKRRDVGLESGAQLLSTDYPLSEPARWAGSYSVGLPGKAVARRNPVNSKPSDDKKLEKDSRN
jgi:Phosphoinositide phospholipase C, Ca2+-dependent